MHIRPFAVVRGLLALLALIGPAMSAEPPGHGQGQSDPLPWRGVVKALHQATLTTDLALPIEAIGSREAEHFKRGDTLVAFDCRRQKHELAALAATVRETMVAVNTNELLDARGASNRNDVEIARARHDKAQAEWAAMAARLEGCRIVAPFDGIVVDLFVNTFETPSPGKPLVTIADVDHLEVEIIVPSARLSDMQPGTELTFRLDDTDRDVVLRVARRGGSVEPISQTAKIYAVFETGDTGILAGMSGTAMLPIGVR